MQSPPFFQTADGGAGRRDMQQALLVPFGRVEPRMAGAADADATGHLGTAQPHDT